jgi:hypothetical protein
MVLTHGDAWAVSGGNNMPLTQFFSNLYQAGVSVYVPMLAFAILVLSVFNWHFGWVTIGEGLGKLILSIAVLALGVSYIVSLVGGNITAGVLL